MHPILSKTFGGLSKQYYFRQIFFGALIALVLIIIPLSQPKHIIQIPIFAIFIAKSLPHFAESICYIILFLR